MVSEGLNSVESELDRKAKALRISVSEGLNSVERHLYLHLRLVRRCVSEGLNSVESWYKSMPCKGQPLTVSEGLNSVESQHCFSKFSKEG